MSVQPRRGLLLVLGLCLLVACSRGDRPSTADWLPSWQAIVAVVPEQSKLGDPPDEALCQDTLADLRVQNEDLLPSPSVTVDDLAGEWIAVAEAAFFDCPPEGEDINSFDDAYEEMERIEESIATALSSQG